MKLITLSDPILLVEQHMRSSRSILRESCDGLDLNQRQIVEGIYQEFVPLIEATLTAQQIQQLFGEVEKTSTASGSNRTVIGRGVDVAKKANEVINNAGKWLQNTTPVKAFDQKFDNLKATVSKKLGQDSKIMQGIDRLGQLAKENPGKTAAVIGILTAIASFAGGPVGGAIAGQVLKGSVELLKGEKLSTAIGKGAKAAAIGWLTGKAIDFIGSALSKPIEIVADKIDPQLATTNGFSRTIREIGGKFGDRFGNFNTGPLGGRPEDLDKIAALFNKATDSWEAGNYEVAADQWQTMQEEISRIYSTDYFDALQVDVERAQDWMAAAEGVKDFAGAMSNLAQGAATGAASNEKKPQQESTYLHDRPLSEGQVYMLFNRVEQLNEGPMDWVKGVAAKGAQKLAQTGKNLTTKVTANKLSKAWQSAGSPTDSAELYSFLQKQGVDPEIIKQVYTTMKLPIEKQKPPAPPGAAASQPKQPGAKTPTTYAQVKANIEKLDKKGRQRLTAYLQKQLGTA